MKYTVKYEIDVCAETPEQAAVIAHSRLLDFDKRDRVAALRLEQETTR